MYLYGPAAYDSNLSSTLSCNHILCTNRLPLVNHQILDPIGHLISLPSTLQARLPSSLAKTIRNRNLVSTRHGPRRAVTLAPRPVDSSTRTGSVSTRLDTTAYHRNISAGANNTLSGSERRVKAHMRPPGSSPDTDHGTAVHVSVAHR